MARLIITATNNLLFTIFLVCFSQTHVVYCHNSGPCASIDYSNKYCPPGEPYCQAQNGDTDCIAVVLDAIMYNNDCCEDAFCCPSTSIL